MVVLSLGPGAIVGASSGVLAFELSHGLALFAVTVAILSAIATIVGIIYGIRWKTAYEVEKAVREAGDDRIRSLAHERDELTEKLEQATRAVHDAQRTIARLEALPNLERVLELVTATFERMRDRLDDMHAENKQTAQQQADRVITEIRRTAA